MNAVSSPSARPGALRVWTMAIRPKTLPVGAAPIIVGWSIAVSHSGADTDHRIGALCMVTALLLQILSNLANDYFDFKKGSDTESRQGPMRVMQHRLVTPTQMKWALGLVTALAAATGTVLIVHGGPVYAVIGGAAILAAVAYTGGPFPLAYNGLGDLFVFLFFGLVAVVGTAHLCTGEIPVYSWPAAGAMGLLAVNLLVVNNVRDEPEDRRNKKKTMVARFGKPLGVTQYALGLFLAYVGVGMVASFAQNNWVFLTGAVAPIGIINLKRLRVLNGQRLNPVLGQTALFCFLFGLVLSGSLLLPHWIHP
ncbi:MAG: 1,4-dihydroxy-2-naphthoate octaprenyltransferase [Deltaproteobacteria bacterium]|nr:1,4-dihydroxy-2-naphthoate octaprenyltransferase [Deltaproteobacteria bacterium]MBN2671782.1 1,4-dihydroxy-2-naphthoate octaprenyltransferase [Deltaproteobacteria bacterium]